jgi:hypothetical protein
LAAEEADEAEAAVAVVAGARVSPASAGPVAKLATSKTPVPWRNATRIRCTGHMGVGLPLLMMAFEEEEAEHSTVQVASMCNFGWEDSPVLDLDDAAVLEEPAEEQGTVWVARNQPQLLDEFGTRARMPAGRTPVPVNRPIVPATTGPGGGAQNPAVASSAEHSPSVQAAAVIPGLREPGIAALTADAGGRASSVILFSQAPMCLPLQARFPWSGFLLRCGFNMGAQVC